MKKLLFAFILLNSCASSELEHRYSSYIEACNDVSYEILRYQQDSYGRNVTLQDHQIIAQYCNGKTQDKFKNFEPESFFSI